MYLSHLLKVIYHGVRKDNIKSAVNIFKLHILVGKKESIKLGITNRSLAYLNRKLPHLKYLRILCLFIIQNIVHLV